MDAAFVDMHVSDQIMISSACAYSHGSASVPQGQRRRNKRKAGQVTLDQLPCSCHAVRYDKPTTKEPV